MRETAVQFFLLIYSRCDTPAFLATRHTTVCLDALNIYGMHVGTVVALTGRTYTNSIGDPDESLYISRYVQIMLNAWTYSTAQVQSII